ncbi:hypothetical protein HN682_09505 [Candidatus Peregrinibacteria bacterium]|jgi:hypothetical protein|nr:hypothetical protein [Candidatus Peregrinibacteria bacterium]
MTNSEFPDLLDDLNELENLKLETETKETKSEMVFKTIVKALKPFFME